MIGQANAARVARQRADSIDASEHEIDRILGGPSHRLATYGSLAPGRSNHHHVAALRGTWTGGWIEGVLHDRGWGAGMGFPGISLEPGGLRVAVWLLESEDLPGHWVRLDAFEGAEYIRLLALMHRRDALPLAANVYALRAAAGGR